MHLPIGLIRVLIVAAVISVHFLASRIRQRREQARALRTQKSSLPETVANLSSPKPLIPK
jgi:hypothetical protein